MFLFLEIKDNKICSDFLNSDQYHEKRFGSFQPSEDLYKLNIYLRVTFFGLKQLN